MSILEMMAVYAMGGLLVLGCVVAGLIKTRAAEKGSPLEAYLLVFLKWPFVLLGK